LTRIPAASVATFNHVALSVPAELLAEHGREELLGFYGEVFGWTEMPTLTRDRELLVLRAHSNEQFVFLAASEEPMRCPSGDHFGMSVDTPEALRALLECARAFAGRDPRVEIEENEVEDFGVLRLHAFYVRYRLPMKIEVQCFEWAPGFGPQSLPDGPRGDPGVRKSG
jgi:hypothetical protein